MTTGLFSIPEKWLKADEIVRKVPDIYKALFSFWGRGIQCLNW